LVKNLESLFFNLNYEFPKIKKNVSYVTDLFPSISLNDFFSVNEHIKPPLVAVVLDENALEE
jgi:hypothetical protein